MRRNIDMKLTANYDGANNILTLLDPEGNPVAAADANNFFEWLDHRMDFDNEFLKEFDLVDASSGVLWIDRDAA